ncbi:DUF4189 domain-containing protein [Methylobacterium radiotolerans]
MSIFSKRSIENLYALEYGSDYDAIGKALDELIYANVTPSQSCQELYDYYRRDYICARMAAYYLRNGSIAPYTNNDIKLFKCEQGTSQRDITKRFLARLRSDKLKASQAPAPPATPPTPPLPQPSPPAIQPNDTNGSWGAYIHVHSTKFYGVAKGYSTEKAAIAAAMNMCRIQQDNGITTGMTAGMDTREKCEVVQTVNNGCISVAMYDGAWGAAVGDNEKEANTEALDACGDKRCSVSHQRSLCSLKSTSAFSPGDQAVGESRTRSASNRVQVCATGQRNADVVLYYVDPSTKKWTKKGWWNINSGTCSNEFSVGDGDVFLFAQDPDAPSVNWSGSDAAQCVPSSKFQMYGTTACPAGERSVGFRRIFSASGGNKYTYRLSD